VSSVGVYKFMCTKCKVCKPLVFNIDKFTIVKGGDLFTDDALVFRSVEEKLDGPIGQFLDPVFISQASYLPGQIIICVWLL